ncbi:cytochrome-c oxidase, cbb3-type subunit III [uncultured Ferrovibrio sp.]|jgi:cytochrome c oxidase, cbb3-type, subunit III|uniref:cytochrome-c oxidase, cbb3-type subunit III n=1 Tax=uncultured Ferrovibrio sp. TaxID=1576913 RepID=UPI0026148914|nr:cytochrome-c oxidase, cbb3-type subunit III [uncultured Ferrovibrio sp.]
MPSKIEKDAISGEHTTGHEWDGIKELNTPLPKWWLYVFYATIIFSIVWMILYPSVPSLSTYFGGTLGYSQRAEVEANLQKAAAAQASFRDRIRSLDITEMKADPELNRFALAGGRVLFAENCAGCHQSGGVGAKGYPNLADDDWLWGGSLEAIEYTIRHGVRSTSDETRTSQMPRFLADGMLTAPQINAVADHVLSLSGLAKPNAEGAAIFAEQCASCHGEKGEGNRDLGAPNLADKIWLYGSDRASVVQTISYSRNGVMPTWSGRLDDATIKMLALYVHALGGGE